MWHMIKQGAVDVKLDTDLLDFIVLGCKLNGTYDHKPTSLVLILLLSMEPCSCIVLSLV
jgi:hypothetical protein